MTYFYRYSTSSSDATNQLSEETKSLWENYAKKSNWRITQLPNGYYQAEFNYDQNGKWQGVTRRETIKGAEKAIDSSIEHYARKLKLAKGPVVVKTFK